jgi:hypothetical protein
MSVVISVSGAKGGVIAGRQVMLTADVSGAVVCAVLPYVWGLPDGDVDGEEATVALTPAEAGLVVVGATVLDEQNSEEAEAFLELTAIEALDLAVSGPAGEFSAGESVAIEVAITGGGVEGEGGRTLTYGLAVDFGAGMLESYDIESPGAIIEHTFADAGSYTVTLTAVSPDGQTVERTIVMETALSLVVATEFWLPEGTVVLGNEIVISIEGSTVEIIAFAYHIETSDAVGFTIDSSGATQTFEADCVSESRRELTGQELSYDSATGTISGTISVLWTRLDRGSECPFGGIDDVQERTEVVVELTLADGVLSGQMVSEERLPRMGLFIVVDTG